MNRYPRQRHDGLPWGGTDDSREQRQGQLGAFRCAVLYLKGDWSEYCNTMGFNNWMSNLRPCLFCCCPPGGLYSCVGLSPLSFPSRLNTHDDYEDACAQCEIAVRVDARRRDVIVAALLYDKRETPGAAKGRALRRDLPGLGLLAGDRLEPNDALPDVATLETLCVEPAVLLKFWRVSAETFATHRNPVRCAALPAPGGLPVLVQSRRVAPSAGRLGPHCGHRRRSNPTRSAMPGRGAQSMAQPPAARTPGRRLDGAARDHRQDVGHRDEAETQAEWGRDLVLHALPGEHVHQILVIARGARNGVCGVRPVPR
eukprot:7061805-Lingulodinium_polyedra.AAC.1